MPVASEASLYLGGTRLGGGGSTPPEPAPWVRPADWLPLPPVNIGDQKLVGLHAVYDHESNFATVSLNVPFTVDWGDGTAPTHFAGGATAFHTYTFTDLPVETLTSRGYRQAVVTVTADPGQTLLVIDLAKPHNQAGLTQQYSSGWLDLRMAGNSVASVLMQATRPRQRLLERFEFVGPSAFTNCDSLFANCNRLRSVVGTEWTAGSTRFSSMFSGCTALQSIPLLNTALGEAFNGMFLSCTSLVDVPLLDTHLSTTFSSMFQGCASLVEVPHLDTRAGTTFASMFQGCTSLPTIPPLDTAAATTVPSMFSGCTALQEIPPLNTELVTNFAFMFDGCTSLPTIPLLDTSGGTQFSRMFNGCTSLQTIPPIDTASVVSSGLVNLFQGCSALQAIPLLKAGAANTFGAMFTGCASLHVGAIDGTSANVDYTNNSLGPDALNSIYTYLAPVNFLSVNAASVETSVVDWNVNVVNAAVTQGTPATALNGPKSLRLTSSAAGEMTSAITTRLTVTPLTQYTFLASVRPLAVALGAQVKIAWYDAAGALLSTDTGVTVSGSTSAWTQATVTASAPANAAKASVILSVTATAAGQVVDFDSMGFFLGTVATWSPTASITVTGNWGTASDNPAIATAKGWTVVG